MLSMSTEQKDIILKSMFNDSMGNIRISGKSNIQEIPHRWENDLQLYSNCRNERKNWKTCDACEHRFKCWTAGNPSSEKIEDCDLYQRVSLERVQQMIDSQMIELDDISTAFKKLSDTMMKRIDDELEDVSG